MSSNTNNCTKSQIQLAWLDETTHCYKFDGVTQPSTNFFGSTNQFVAEANHLTQFIYVDKAPSGSNNAKFQAIWIIIILYNIFLGIILGLSFLACLCKNKQDFENREKFNIGADEDQ